MTTPNTYATKLLIQQQLEHTHRSILHLERTLRENPNLPQENRDKIDDRMDDLNDLFIMLSNKL